MRRGYNINKDPTPETDTHPQIWAPSAYNPRPIDVSLGISLHRTDLEREGSEPDRVSGLDRARINQHRVENGQQGQAERAGRVECLKYPADIGRVSSGYRVRKCHEDVCQLSLNNAIARYKNSPLVQVDHFYDLRRPHCCRECHSC